MIINPEFFSDNLEGFKVKEKMIVHEFAKKLWGVFEEHGYPGDPHFPLLYNVIIIDIHYISIHCLSSIKRHEPDYSTLAPNLCSSSQVAWHTEDAVTGGECVVRADEAPDHNCRLIIDDSR